MSQKTYLIDLVKIESFWGTFE